MSLSKSFKAIHHTFVRSHYQLKIIVVAKFHHTIRLHIGKGLHEDTGNARETALNQNSTETRLEE